MVTGQAAKASESVVNSLIDAWKRARLSRDAGSLGYPQINILHPEYGIAGDGDIETDDEAVKFVQGVVEGVTPPYRAAFEAFHLGIIRGTYCQRRPHKWRWLVLGLEKRDYFDRCNYVRGKIAESYEGRTHSG